MSTSRYDGFVIWGHGLPYIEEIMGVLRSRFKIIIILRKQIDDMRSFVDAVYSTDTYPVGLIREKTEYLLHESPSAVFVLVRNDHVDLWDVDMGKYAKKECRYVAHTKVMIREQYNKHPHHHVIHGTDNEDQTRHLLSLFGGQSLEFYLQGLGTPFPFHIAPFEYEVVDVDLRSLRGKLYGDFWGRYILDAPHYAYVNGNPAPYTDYFYSHYGVELIEDHFPGKFDDMINAYDNGTKFPPLTVINDRIIDGGHRAAILLARGVTSYPAYKMVEKPTMTRPPKRVLLIGGTGGVGRVLANSLDPIRYEVCAIGRKDLDVLDTNASIAKFDNPEVVVLLSGMLSSNDLAEHNPISEEMIRLNCMGAVNVLRWFLPPFRERGYGTIILMSSVFSDIVVNNTGIYSATKSFVDKLAQVAASENAEYGVTVNSIQLGYTGVGMCDVADRDVYELMKKKPPLKRFCAPLELARTIEYLIETQYITGQNIKLSGGL